MIHWVTGNLLESSARALVNPVNCEGTMGKGLAFQFKRKFPLMNADYVRLCRDGGLRPGTLHVFSEGEKLIINFPTKDRWREKSKMKYIEMGLEALISRINSDHITSIAIPPLGSGNGGLHWPKVRNLLEISLTEIASTAEVLIYEPSKNAGKQEASEPRLAFDEFVLMELKEGLKSRNAFRLQTAAFFTTVTGREWFFPFVLTKNGVQNYEFPALANNIRAFQTFHNASTSEALIIAYGRMITDSKEKTLRILRPRMEKACHFVDSVEDAEELACMSAICAIVDRAGSLAEDAIVGQTEAWCRLSERSLSKTDILSGIRELCAQSYLESFDGAYTVAREKDPLQWQLAFDLKG